MLRDPLTTLLTQAVFDLVLAQEALRAQRHQHGVAMILFDIDNLGPLHRVHGLGAGDRILERLGILARRFFRTYDWVARHGDDSIAVLLPETTLDQAAALLGKTARDVSRLVRAGTFGATRRGRHLHIDRAQIDAYRARRD